MQIAKRSKEAAAELSPRRNQRGRSSECTQNVPTAATMEWCPETSIDAWIYKLIMTEKACRKAFKPNWGILQACSDRIIIELTNLKHLWRRPRYDKSSRKTLGCALQDVQFGLWCYIDASDLLDRFNQLVKDGITQIIMVRPQLIFINVHGQFSAVIKGWEKIEKPSPRLSHNVKDEKLLYTFKDDAELTKKSDNMNRLYSLTNHEASCHDLVDNFIKE